MLERVACFRKSIQNQIQAKCVRLVLSCDCCNQAAPSFCDLAEVSGALLEGLCSAGLPLTFRLA